MRHRALGATERREALVSSINQMRLKARLAIRHGTHRYQWVVGAGQVRSCAGPRPVLGARDTSGPHRIEADIAHRGHQMGLDAKRL